MLEFKFTNLDEAIKQLDEDEKKHLPFALARGLTWTAKAAQQEAVRQMDFKIDNPTAFTKRGVRFQSARKGDDPFAVVYIQDIQAEYLKWIIDGGLKVARTLLKPGNIRLNKHGNIAKGRIRKLLDKPNHFKGEVNGVSGVWQRLGKKKRKRLKLIAKFDDSQQYNKTYPFYKITLGIAGKTVEKNVLKSLEMALD